MKTNSAVSKPGTDTLHQAKRIDVKTQIVAESFADERIASLLFANQRLEHELHQAKLQLAKAEIRIQEARNEERQLISQDLHDELGQYLITLKISLGLLLREQEATSPLHQELQNNLNTLDACAASARNLVAKLQKPAITENNFFTELDKILSTLDKMGITVSREITTDTLTLPAPALPEIYHILQEAFTNILKHARASQVMLTVQTTSDNCFQFMVSDNGVGIQEKDQPADTCFGLTGKQNRAARIQAILNISRLPSGGTCVKLLVPSIL